MSVLDYEPDAMDALAASLLRTATLVMAERSRINFTTSPDFVGPAATRFLALAHEQAQRLDAVFGDLVAAASTLSSKAADIRVDQQKERARIEAAAQETAATKARGGRR